MRRLWGRVEEADKAELELELFPLELELSPWTWPRLRFWFLGERGRVGGDGGRGP